MGGVLSVIGGNPPTATHDVMIGQPIPNSPA